VKSTDALVRGRNDRDTRSEPLSYEEMLREFLRDLQRGPLLAQLRRFVIVGSVAAGVQLVLLWMFVDKAGLNYLLGALIAIEITILFQYTLNNAWTFRATRNATTSDYLTGLLKTNVVRGTAIPIQLGILYVLVNTGDILYLLANVVAIGVSGVYRYVLDSRWTWR
jgi:putative flippase GtrA